MKQNSKKILFLTRLYSPHVGGVEKHVNKITRELLLKKIQITIITELHDTRLKKREQQGRATIYRIPVSKNIFLKKFYIWIWFLNNLDLIKNSDIVHAHDVFYWMLPFRFLFLKKKFYITFHGYEDYPVKYRWIFQRKIYEKLSSGTICIGEFMKKWYKANPSNVLYGSADLPKRIKASSSVRSALFFGRLEKQTNAKEYVRAAVKIKELFTNFNFKIVGQGPLEDELSKYSKIFPFDPMIENEIQNYNYIFVSRYLSILEAFANKRLVFAFYENPLKHDYLKLTPFKNFIVAVNSEKELIEKLLYFMKNTRKAKEMTDLGYNWVSKNNWRTIADSYLNLWGINK